jgi:hypothetical protein
VKLHRGQPPDRRPSQTRVNTIRVDCNRSGPEVTREAYNTFRQYTLADVEAWAAELRRLGAGDDLALDKAEGLTVTVDAGS